MDKQFDHGTKIHGTKRSAIELRRLITTIDGMCPKCGRHSLIKYIDDEVLTGCLGCGWKEVDSIDQSIQKSLDSLKRSLDSLKRMLDNF